MFANGLLIEPEFLKSPQLSAAAPMCPAALVFWELRLGVLRFRLSQLGNAVKV